MPQRVRARSKPQFVAATNLALGGTSLTKEMLEIAELRTRLLQLESKHARLRAQLDARGETIKRLRQMSDGAADSVLLHDGEGRILESNRQACLGLGYHPGELAGKHLGDIDATFASLDDEGVRRALAQLESGSPVTRRSRALSRDGSRFHTEMRTALFERDSLVKGQAERLFVAVIRDISDRVRFDEALRESVQRFRFLFESSPVGMAIADEEGVLRDANAAFATMMQFDSPEELEATGLRSLAHPDDRHNLHVGLTLLTHGELEVMRRGQRFMGAKGKDVFVQLVVFGERAENRLRQMIVVALDMTDQRRAEENLQRLLETLEAQVKVRTAELEAAKVAAEAASQAKSQFLANMSHELRTPLNAIIGYAEMLQEDALETNSPELQATAQDLSKIQRSGKHLLGLISDILDLSKIEAGRMELYWEHVELEKVVADVIETLAPIAAQRGNQLVVETDDLGDTFVDATKLRQILINLISNANKFSENSVVHVLCERRWGRDGEEELAFEIIDRGIGIDAETLTRLFQPFTQADASTTRKYGGTGLGLAISKRFAEIMGGSISASSKPGYGSTFVVHLPALSELPKPRIAPLPTVPPRLSGGDVVLVIDEDPPSEDLLVRVLRKAGYRVESTHVMSEGLTMAKSLKPAAVILDPEGWSLAGWDVLEKLKTLDATAEIPVLLVSVTPNRERSKLLGADAWITKPMDRDGLLRSLRPYASPRK
ncbi:MAG: PAS domain S-box-containing protein [Polyangiales bacterium]|jgi:PAS domain S-box-containing protein